MSDFCPNPFALPRYTRTAPSALVAVEKDAAWAPTIRSGWASPSMEPLATDTPNEGCVARLPMLCIPYVVSAKARTIGPAEATGDRFPARSTATTAKWYVEFTFRRPAVTSSPVPGAPGVGGAGLMGVAAAKFASVIAAVAYRIS